MFLVRNLLGFRLMLAPFPHRFLIHHHRSPGNGQLTSAFIVPSIRTRKYSTGDNMEGTAGIDGADGLSSTDPDELSNLSSHVTILEKTCCSEIQEGFSKLKAELINSLDKTLDKRLAPTNSAIEDTRWWNRWILGTLIMGFLLEAFVYDRYTKEKLLKKVEDSECKRGTMIQDSEKRLTKMVKDSLSKFKLELKVVELEKEKMSDQDKKKC